MDRQDGAGDNLDTSDGGVSLAGNIAAGSKFSVHEQASQSQIQIPFEADVEINNFLCAEGGIVLYC